MRTMAVGRPRRDRLIRERIHDPYKTRLKLREPTVCPRCRAVFHSGRWQWMKAPPLQAPPEICQACHRIRDRYPAGIVTLSGGFAQAHKAEILNLARHQAAQETQDHPLHRIMDIEERPGRIVIRTTDIHLPRRIGEAVQKGFKGKLDLHYDEESYTCRADWSREV